jgi:pyrroloquinoline quinone biosynthesis protein D
MALSIEPTSTPRFAKGVKFRMDAVREAWVILAPERLFLPDEHAVEILKRVDGRSSIQDIVDQLAAQFAAPAEVIRDDVLAMLQDLADKGVVAI